MLGNQLTEKTTFETMFDVCDWVPGQNLSGKMRVEELCHVDIGLVRIWRRRVEPI